MSDASLGPNASPTPELTLATLVSMPCGRELALNALLADAILVTPIRDKLESLLCSNLAPGDTVQLRSGGPPMTIASLDSSSSLANCCWFDATGRLHTQTFPKIAIYQPRQSDADLPF